MDAKKQLLEQINRQVKPAETDRKKEMKEARVLQNEKGVNSRVAHDLVSNASRVLMTERKRDFDS
jgi:hypothetical protein